MYFHVQNSLVNPKDLCVCFLVDRARTQVAGTPPLHNVGFKNILVETEQCRTPYKVSTTSQFGTPSGVLHCSMSPQLFFQAHIVQRPPVKGTGRAEINVFLTVWRNKVVRFVGAS